MKKIDVKNKAQIKLLLTCKYVLGVKGDQFKSFGGFQLWWYNDSADRCNSCEILWSDLLRKLNHHELDEAVKTLWRCRRDLHIANQHTVEARTTNPFATEPISEITEHIARPSAPRPVSAGSWPSQKPMKQTHLGKTPLQYS